MPQISNTVRFQASLSTGRVTVPSWPHRICPTHEQGPNHQPVTQQAAHAAMAGASSSRSLSNGRCTLPRSYRWSLPGREAHQAAIAHQTTAESSCSHSHHRCQYCTKPRPKTASAASGSVQCCWLTQPPQVPILHRLPAKNSGSHRRRRYRRLWSDDVNDSHNLRGGEQAAHSSGSHRCRRRRRLRSHDVNNGNDLRCGERAIVALCVSNQRVHCRRQVQRAVCIRNEPGRLSRHRAGQHGRHHVCERALRSERVLELVETFRKVDRRDVEHDAVLLLGHADLVLDEGDASQGDVDGVALKAVQPEAVHACTREGFVASELSRLC